MERGDEPTLHHLDLFTTSTFDMPSYRVTEMIHVIKWELALLIFNTQTQMLPMKFKLQLNITEDFPLLRII